MKTEKITSAQNPKIRELTPLQHRSSYRRETGLFVAEGRREVSRCLDAGYRPRTIFYCPEIIGEADLAKILVKVRAAETAVSKDCGTGTGNDMAERNGFADDESKGRRAVPSGGDTGRGRAKNCTAGAENVMAVEIPAEIYDKVAYRGGTEGILAVMHTKEHRLEDLHLENRRRENPCPEGNQGAAEGSEKGHTTAWAPLIVVLEGVEKPGNLGAVLRSADAAGADAVILCDSPSDLYNPNVIRASTGTVFSMPIAECTTAEAINWLRERGVKILTAQLQDSKWYYDTDMVNSVRDAGTNDGGDEMTHSGKGVEVEGEGMKVGGVAIVMGTEDKGLTDAWREAADAHIKIPMLGQADSLNVSVSAAVFLYEAVRQRRQAGLL